MSGKTILISPLNWGFGHAGRMIPLALELKKRGNNIIFGAEPYIIPMLEGELPEITLITIPGIKIRYSRLLPQYICILFQLPLIIAASIRENFALKHLARELKPDIIISDNRFGFFHKRIFSVYVTHMLRIPFPKPFSFAEPLGIWLHRLIISRYDLCLIPDYPGEVNLSGRLSHGVKMPANATFIGPLSRFAHQASLHNVTPSVNPYCCVIASGPEPQRSLLIEKIIPALPGIKLLILTGTALSKKVCCNDNVTVITKPDTEKMREVISSGTSVIARAGYTTVMELVSLGKAGVIIPTPGQTEQEYLSKYLNSNYGFTSLAQKHISRVDSVISEMETHPMPVLPDSAALLEDALKRLFEKKIK